MAKNQTPEQKFKKLFDLSNDEATTQGERESAQRKWQAWLKRHGKKQIDISAILAKAERDDEAANPPPPPPPPPDPIHPYDDPAYNPATLIEEITCRYVAMRPHVRVIFVLGIIATHVHTQFRIAPRILLTSEMPAAGKTTALEIARRLMFRANEEAFASEAAIRDHLDEGPGSIALDEGDLLDAEARRALLRLWNAGHLRGARYAMMVGGRRKLFNLFAPMIAAGLGRILGEAQLSRTLILGMSKYSAAEKPEFEWSAPAEEGPDSEEAREQAFGELYNYLRHCAANWKLDRRPPLPSGITHRDADNARSMLAVATMCGEDWLRRGCEAIVVLLNEMNAKQPKALIRRHGLMLFEHFEAEWLEVGHFNQELRRLSAPEFDWNQFRGVSGLDMHPRPISVSEQGRLLSLSGIRSHTKWPPGMSRAQRQEHPAACRRVYRRADFEEASRKTEPSSSAVLRLIKPSAG